MADGEALTPAVRELSSGLAFFIGIARAGAWQNPMKSTSSGNAASTPDIAEKKMEASVNQDGGSARHL